MNFIFALVAQLVEHSTFNAGVVVSITTKRTTATKIRSGKYFLCKGRNLQLKIFSEKTNKYYNTVEECLEAEKEYDEAVLEAENKKKELAENRKNRAKEVEDAYKARLEADKVFKDKLNKFVDDYGSFHMTINTEVDDPFNLFDIFDSFPF